MGTLAGVSLQESELSWILITGALLIGAVTIPLLVVAWALLNRSKAAVDTLSVDFSTQVKEIMNSTQIELQRLMMRVESLEKTNMRKDKTIISLGLELRDLETHMETLLAGVRILTQQIIAFGAIPEWKIPDTVVNFAQNRSQVQGYSRVELYEKMDQYLSMEDVKAMFFSLSVPYDNIPGDTKPDKLRGFIEYLHRDGRIEELIYYLREKRPRISW